MKLDLPLLKLVKKYGTLFAVIFCHCSLSIALAEESIPIGMIGGQGDAPYGALLEPDGSLKTLIGLPPTGLTYRVAMNSSGIGLIGGTNGLNAYAAVVSPDATVKPIAGLMSPGEIYTVAINQRDDGMIGGGHLIANTPTLSIPFAALVSQNAIATPITGLPAQGLIYSVAIDPYGEGIIGGVGPLNSAYAAIVSPNGSSLPIADLPTTGAIYWVSVNHSSMKLIGGQDGSSVYAAFVDPKGTLNAIQNLPLGLNYSVAINDSGYGIMGGTSLSLPFAAQVNPEGVVNRVIGLPETQGVIYTVAINDSGTGLIAGYSTSGPYGTFIAPSGALTPLMGLPIGTGFLDGVALHSSGIGLVGGEFSGSPFAALAAPNGTLTYLNGLPDVGAINSTAFATLDSLVPKSIGPFDSWANMQFAFSDALTQHSMIHHKSLFQSCSCYESDDTNCGNALWAAIFGNYVDEKNHHNLPSFTNDIAGIVFGFDYKDIQNVVLGGGLGFAFNDVRYFEGLGHAQIYQETAVFYASFNQCPLFINAALWGGVFQESQKRNSLGFITSRAHPRGWNVTPHLELSRPINLNQKLTLEPFFAFDWANQWQNHYQESGSAGFNIALKKQYASILRSEVGMRFYESFDCDAWQFLMEEKLSYINRTPTHHPKGKAAFVGAFSSFDVETLSPFSQNLGVVQVHIECLPQAFTSLYASIDYQGEFGSSFESHMLTFSMGKNF